MKYKHSKEEVAALCKNASTCTECEFYNGARIQLRSLLF